MKTPLDSAEIAAVLAEAGASVIVRGWLSANSIVFTDRDTGSAVVDTGYFSHAAQTEALVGNALRGAPLDRILNTHLHSDHCGGNAPLLARWPLATLQVPAGYRDRLEPWDDDRLSYRQTGQQCGVFRPTGYLDAGATVELQGRRWDIHAAPGHDPDALILFQPDTGVLISGDALWERKLAIIFPELAGEDGFDAAHAALDTIEQLRPRVVIPGHGLPFADIAAALKSSRRRIDAFAAAPLRHRRHSARALLMYHLLEHRVREREHLLRWVATTPIFRQALQCEDDDAMAYAMAVEIVDSLVGDRLLLASAGQIQLPTES